ncbi:MAG: hypothetical protein RL390_882 [Actinomycetota bacterium]
MAKKNGFFNWVGYKEETEPSMSSVDRIRELEASTFKKRYSFFIS